MVRNNAKPANDGRKEEMEGLVVVAAATAAEREKRTNRGVVRAAGRGRTG